MAKTSKKETFSKSETFGQFYQQCKAAGQTFRVSTRQFAYFNPFLEENVAGKSNGEEREPHDRGVSRQQV
jgi:hypothetical protein